jgi:polygalacturonase
MHISVQSHNFNVCQLGAVGDGKTLATPAIQTAIDQCFTAGGGTVYVPNGRYLVGTLELKSGVELHLEAGATLLGSTQREHYRPFPLGVDGYKPDFDPEYLIYARDAHNIALSGRGTIDGNGLLFYGPEMQADGLNYKLNFDWRPLNLIALIKCVRVKIKDITIRNSPGYAIWPLGCEELDIDGITIRNHQKIHNGDGIDPDSCRNVRITRCDLDVADDCIILRSSRQFIKDAPVMENVVISDCVFRTKCAGIRIGYSGDSPIRNCTIGNIVMHDVRCGINILVPRQVQRAIYHGPSIERIQFHDIEMQTRCPLYVCVGEGATAPACLKDVSFHNIRATGSRCSLLTGIRELPIENISLRNIDITLRGDMDQKYYEVPDPYRIWDYWDDRGVPDAMFFRHVRGLHLDDVKIRYHDLKGDWRHALHCHEVSDLRIHQLRTSSPTGKYSAVNLCRTAPVQMDHVQLG